MTLKSIGIALMAGSITLMMMCAWIAFTQESNLAIGFLVLSHSIIMLSAVGVKLGYIVYLEGASRKVAIGKDSNAASFIKRSHQYDGYSTEHHVSS